MPGFQLIRNQTNSEYPGPLETFIFPSQDTKALAIGDLVVIGTTAGGNGVQEVVRPTVKVSANAGDLSASLVGVVMGNDIDPDNEVVGIPANSASRDIRVSTGQYAIYEVDVTGTSIVNAMVGLNCTVVIADSTVSSLSTSGMTIDGTTNTPTITDAENWPFRLVGITEYDESNQATKVLVRPNITVLSTYTGDA